jgi:two-component system, cell cycle response regulator
MQGKILIIDGISTNRIVLKVKLTTAFYQVVQAGTLRDALRLVHTEQPDLIITAVNLPDGTAAQLCDHRRASAKTANLPVLAIGSTPDTDVRLATLQAGAFDVMEKPVNEMLLLGRVRNMIRSYHMIAEWHMRDETACALGLAEAPAEFVHSARVSLIGTKAPCLQGWARHLQAHLRATYAVTFLPDAMAALHSEPPPDALVLAIPDDEIQSDYCLRLISALRASTLTRDVALLVLQNTPNPIRATTALDMGADDVMIDGFDAAELCLRLKELLRRKRHMVQMLQSVRSGLREVVIDPLTGLYNRRYAMPFMSRLIDHSATTKSQFAVVVADMDHFKRINDVYGHASGDAVLIETARRLRETVRRSDMVARMGGEEFLIIMPATDIGTARAVAVRLCEAIGRLPFSIPDNDRPVHVTISIGVATSTPTADSKDASTLEEAGALLDRADKALYAAKTEGRNCVKYSHPLTRPTA